MKQKILLLNRISVIMFFLSSFSLLGIPFLNLDNEIPILGYFIAILFWSGLLIGTSLQVCIAMMAKKMEIKRTNKERHIFIVTGIFLILFVLTICFFEKSIVLMSVDIAFLLFSIEMYFYLKWRYSV